MIIRLLYITFIVLLSSSTYAQDSTLTKKEKRQLKRIDRAKSHEQYKVGALCLTQTGIQDTRMSSLIFRGIGAGIDFQNLIYSEKSYREFQLKGTTMQRQQQ